VVDVRVDHVLRNDVSLVNDARSSKNMVKTFASLGSELVCRLGGTFPHQATRRLGRQGLCIDHLAVPIDSNVISINKHIHGLHCAYISVCCTVIINVTFVIEGPAPFLSIIDGRVQSEAASRYEKGGNVCDILMDAC
jgi:hypothetical protein